VEKVWSHKPLLVFGIALSFFYPTVGLGQSDNIFEGLKVTLCGTSSPIPAPGRAQACVAIETPDHLFIVDAGSGSAATAQLANIPQDKLRGILITHYHSDHISDIGDFNLNSWVAGRQAPLLVIGPEGADRVVDGLNMAYELDRGYRVAHHGADLLKPELGILQSRVIEEGIIIEQDGLRITAFEVSHPPIEPAYGYRLDYGGRSVVISGDSLVTEKIIEISNGADVVLHDAMALQLVRGAESFARNAGNERVATVLHDIQDYHATTSDLSRLVDEAAIGQLALYHLVPAPRNAMAVAAFTNGVPDGAIITEDGMIFSLPSNSELIIID
tara:strand:- start:309 stop:1295 length:987 start_codon:yes stop_codon:yes gene_type:complete